MRIKIEKKKLYNHCNNAVKLKYLPQIRAKKKLCKTCYLIPADTYKIIQIALIIEYISPFQDLSNFIYSGKDLFSLNDITTACSLHCTV